MQANFEEKHCKMSMTAPSHPKEAHVLSPFALESVSGKLVLPARVARVSQLLQTGETHKIDHPVA